MVAERLGVTRQALYYHFPTKAALLEAICDERMTALGRSAAASQPAAGEPRLAAILRGHLKITLDRPAPTTVLVHERAETDRITSLRAAERRDAYTSQIALAYVEGIAQGALRATDPSRAAKIIVAAADSVILWWRPQSEPLPAGVVDDTLSLLLSGFAPG